MIKRLSRCIREYKRDSILAPVFVTCEVIMEVIIPLLMVMMIDQGIDAADMGVVRRVGIALVAATLFSLLFGILSGKHAASAGAGFAKNLRHDMYQNIQNFSFKNIDKFSTSSLVTRLTTDITYVQNAYQMILRMLVRSPVMLLFAMIMSFGINARLSLVFLAVVPFMAILLYLLINKAFPIFQRVFQTYDKLNGVVQENLRGIRVVKSYVREKYEISKFKKVSGQIFDNFSLAEKIMAFMSPLMQFSMYACTIVISWFGARMIVSSEMTTGQLNSLLSYTMQILMGLMMIAMVITMITISRASAQRIAEVLEEDSDLAGADSPVTQLADGSIRFENVSFSYSGEDGKLCLRDVSLTIQSGQTVGIIGGTGSAKTTLVQLIPRLYDATSGKILVGGADVREYDLHTLRDAVSMVLQKNVLFSGTIKENLRWGDKNASDKDLERACRQAQADGFIESFPEGYDTFIEQGGANVSGGQKQRLCIARALLKRPKILILDDSTSAVDTKTDALIRQAFREEIPDTTKIIIAQRISSVSDADLIVVMDGGRVADAGTHDELMESSDIYREVYESQMKGGDGNGAA